MVSRVKVSSAFTNWKDYTVTHLSESVDFDGGCKPQIGRLKIDGTEEYIPNAYRLIFKWRLRVLLKSGEAIFQAIYETGFDVSFEKGLTTFDDIREMYDEARSDLQTEYKNKTKGTFCVKLPEENKAVSLMMLVRLFEQILPDNNLR